MGWDKKKGGHSGGYFYESRRVPDKPYPVKIYRGRGAIGQLAAAVVEMRKREQRAGTNVVRAEAAATAAADAAAAELYEWARLYMAAWLTATGHRCHRGQWRRRRET